MIHSIVKLPIYKRHIENDITNLHVFRSIVMVEMLEFIIWATEPNYNGHVWVCPTKFT